MRDENDQTVNGDAKAIKDNDDDVDNNSSCEDSEDEDPEQVKTRIWPVARTAVATYMHWGLNELLDLNLNLNLEFLAQGAYHHVWLVTFSAVPSLLFFLFFLVKILF